MPPYSVVFQKFSKEGNLIFESLHSIITWCQCPTETKWIFSFCNLTFQPLLKDVYLIISKLLSLPLETSRRLWHLQGFALIGWNLALKKPDGVRWNLLFPSSAKGLSPWQQRWAVQLGFCPSILRSVRRGFPAFGDSVKYQKSQSLVLWETWVTGGQFESSTTVAISDE